MSSVGKASKMASKRRFIIIVISFTSRKWNIKTLLGLFFLSYLSNFNFY